ncbi:2-methylisocitrate lyase-like PEP mutase family enzyme OS=Streptomyces albaduncus OX=68172 GN=FHS32_001303 PE=4 SV=1 [Streptomyces griseoloalbus]
MPGLADPDAIAGLVRALDGCPLNVLYTPDGPSLAHLARLGVRRVSLGSLPYRRALGAALDAVLAVREGRPAGEGTVPSYREVQDLVR